MGQWLTSEDSETWTICSMCGASQEQMEQDRQRGASIVERVKNGECLHNGGTTDVCDDDDCEACNNDPVLWALGLRMKPDFPTITEEW